MKMPYLVATAQFPTAKWKEVAEKFLEIRQKYPRDENLGTMVVPSASKTTKQGVQVISILG